MKLNVEGDRHDTSRCLAAGLAGAVFFGFAPGTCLAGEAAAALPGDPTAGALAVKAAFADVAGVGEPVLRLSQALMPIPRRRASTAGGQQGDPGLYLQASPVLSLPGAAPGQGAPLPDPAGGRPGGPGVALQNDSADLARRRPAAVAASGMMAAEAPPSAPGPVGGETPSSGLAWGIPPIRWGGMAGYSIQRSSASDTGAVSLSQAISTNFNASSYVYAPWMATVAGRIGLSQSSSSSNSGSGGASANNASVGGQDHNKAASITGGGEINLFPVSRFPFQAFFDRSDSRASGTLVSSDYVNTRFGMRENYRSEDGVGNGAVHFDRSTVDSSGGGQDTVTALGGNYATTIGSVQNNFNAQYSLGERSGSGERARLIGMNSSHSLSLEDNIHLSGNVGFIDNSLRTGATQGGLSTSGSRSFQLNGFGSWQPEFEDTDDMPLSLSGGLRYSSVTSEFGSQKSSFDTAGANVSAFYRFSNNFMGGATGVLNHIRTADGRSILLPMATANLNYSGTPLEIKKFSYNWNAGSNVSWQGSSGQTPSTYSYGLQAGHSVGRFLPVSETDSLSLTLAQSLSASENQGVGMTTSLSNSANVGYGLRWGEQFSGNIAGSVSDILTNGVNSLHYRQASLSFFGNGQFSPLSSANVNLQLNWSDQLKNQLYNQANPGFQNNGSNQHMTLTGSAYYNHSRFFGVRGLRYSVILNADTRLRDERLLGNVNGNIDRTRWSLTNRLDYRIGLLNFAASAALNDTGGKKNALLFFQVTRQIGGY